MKCPICSGELKDVKSFMIVMDGNSVYECEQDKEHRFWRHPFRYKVLHFHPNASIRCSRWILSYDLDDNDNAIDIHLNPNYMQCPICFGELEYEEDLQSCRIMDGISIFQCRQFKEHRFWRHPFNPHILKLNPDATVMSHRWLKAYEYDKEGNVIAIHVNEENIGKTGDMRD